MGGASSQGRTRRAIVVCDQWLGSNGYAGERALRRAGWATTVIPERELIPLCWTSLPMRVLGRAVRPFGVREFNRALLRAADAAAPELLLVFKGAFVQGETLERFRARGIRCYCFYPDVSFRTHGPYLPRALPRYDWIFTTKTFGLHDLQEQLGVTNASLLHHAYDPDLHRPLTLTDADRTTYGCDVSFIGTWSPKKEALLRALHDRRPGLSVRVWGEQWHRASGSPEFRRSIGGRGVHGDEYVRALAASKINLGILSERRTGASDGDRITSRTFHIPACGAFMLHERTSEVLEIFEDGESVVCYDGIDEMVERIDQYLAEPQQRHLIASRGRAVVEAAHSWDHRIRDILALHEAATW